MAPPSSTPDLDASWRALRGSEAPGEGWKTIAVSASTSVPLAAGIHFPGREEALLVSFTRKPDRDLPHGNGFAVERIADTQDGERYWLALTRAPSADPGLFGKMAEDVVDLLIGSRPLQEVELLHAFLRRIRSWQRFMSRAGDDRLAPEAELGLIGELSVFALLLAGGVPQRVVTSAWEGPLHGLHDFALGDGAIEVKCTLARAGFPARVSSLQQLDHTLVSPLFLAAVRGVLQVGAPTLPERIAALRAELRMDPSVLSVFEKRLLLAGFDDRHEPDYTRRIGAETVRLMAVDDHLPGFRRTTTPAAIRSASYELDLEMCGIDPTPLTTALGLLGLQP